MSERRHPPLSDPRPGRGPLLAKLLTFAAICVICISLAGGYAWIVASRQRGRLGPEALPPATSVTAAAPAADAAAISPAPSPPSRSEQAVIPTPSTPEPAVTAASTALMPAPTPGPVVPPVPSPATGTLLVRHTALDQSFGRLAIVSGPGGADRRASDLHCDRIYFAVARGVCLTVDRAYTSRVIIIFDAGFQVLFKLPLAGIPSRVRLSPNGRLAATTSFVAGHSYGDDIFATETNIIDTYSGERLINNLQDLEITRNGSRVQEIDFNVWGVTFAPDSDRFFATLGTGGKALLLEGRVATKQMRVVYEGVECPSLSPDGQRIVFKKKLVREGATVWQLTALDLSSYTETALAEMRTIDDQVEWLDAATVLYAVPREGGMAVTDLWRARADGGGTPELFLRNAASPSVQRGE